MQSITEVQIGMTVLVNRKKPKSGGPWIGEIKSRVERSHTKIYVEEVGLLPLPNEHEPGVVARSKISYKKYMEAEETPPIFVCHISELQAYDGEVSKPHL